MFDSYDNLSEDYIPNNMFPLPPAVSLTVNDTNILVKRDHCGGQIIGFSWNYGDTVSIPLSLNLNIAVYPNDIVYSKDKTMSPNSHYTIAEIGDRFYNTLSLKSWRLDSIIPVAGYSILTEEPYNFKDQYYYYYELVDSEYIPLGEEVEFEENTYYRDNFVYLWIEDEKLTFFSDGVTPVTLSPDLEGKIAKVVISNFRHEKMFEYEYKENSFNVEIDAETSSKLNPGIYYLSLSLESEDKSSISLVKTFELFINNYKVS